MRGMVAAMPRFASRPGRPLAVLIGVAAVVLLIFGISQMVRVGEFHWFVVLWVVAGLAVIGLALRRILGRPRP
jgi:hypothetical protein